MIRESGPRVELYLEALSRPSPELEDRLDYSKPDDEIVGCCYRYSREHPSSDVRLLTHDGGPMMTARSLGMPFVLIPDSWLLAPENSLTERENARLKEEINRLKKAEPEFTIRCVDAGDREIEVLEFQCQIFEPLTESEISELIEALKSRYPVSSDFTPTERPRRDNLSSASPLDRIIRSARIGEVFVPASQQEIAKYRKEDYPEWIEISDDVAMPEEETFAPVTNMFRIFRNGKIMGQVLRTKHGSLNIKKLNEIVETIAEAGLRLITLSLLDEQQINRIKELMRSQIKEIDLHIEDVDDEQLAMGIEYLMFMWILINIQQIVHCINVPEIDDIVKNIVARKNSVAFDLIGYCAMLESAPKLTWRERRALAALLDKHDNVFVKRVLSFATQGYMGTHTSDAPVEQSICALLGIKYMARPNAGR